MVTFGGALGYTEAREMPIPELMLMHREAKRIQQAITEPGGK